MSQQDTVKFALSFAHGHILFTERHGSYFLPAGSMDAFQIYGDRKELFGKNAISVRGNRETGEPDYSVVYEFNDAQALTDARLVTRDQTLRGTLADQDTINSFNGALAQGALTLYTTNDTRPDTIFNVARFTDGRYLIQTFNTNTLYLGTPGNYQKLDAQLHVQGGNSMYYRDADGGEIALPYGFGEPRFGEPPVYKGEELNYVRMKQNGDPAEFGLELKKGIVHLSPFHPALDTANTPASAPKPLKP